MQEDVYPGDGLNLYAYCENNPPQNVITSSGSSSKGSINQVEYGGTDLSQEAIRYGQENNIAGIRNIAVFEYENNGQLNTIAGSSQRNQGHAEYLIAKELENMGIQPIQVRRIYSKLEPYSILGDIVNDSCKKYFHKLILHIVLSMD